jgi:hypothetical protein
MMLGLEEASVEKRQTLYLNQVFGMSTPLFGTLGDDYVYLYI